MDRIGRYEIVAELGRGGRGVVYRAVDPLTGRTVALKTVRFAHVADRNHFLRKARTAGRLSHPGIVAIHDVGHEGGLVAFIAMEYVDGPTLERVLARPEPLDKALIGKVLREAAAALDYAHTKGVLHRDLKPANIMLDEHGTAKLRDFGLAKSGTLAYMSAEQMQGLVLNGHADQYSLAVVAYQMLTGNLPITADTLVAQRYKAVRGQHTSPRLFNRTLGTGVERVFRRSFSRDPYDRYPSCAEFLEALEAAWTAVVDLGGVLMEFARIAPGEFVMGSDDGHDDEKPPHRVRITKAFEMGRYPVTQAQWEAVMGSNPSRSAGANCPVDSVSWDDAKEFLTKLNARRDGYRYRLPTEAEWEYAARAGTTGDWAGDIDAMAWHRHNRGWPPPSVGRKQANAWGLYDMHGNVWEWCQDWYSETYYRHSAAQDPQGPSTGELKTLRGGSRNDVSWYLRSAYRLRYVPGFRDRDFGFRCVREFTG